MIDHLCEKCGSPVPGDAQFCPNCGTASKPHRVQGERAPSSRKSLIRFIIPIVLGTVLLFGLSNYFGEAFRTYHPVIEKQPTVSKPWALSSEKQASTKIEARSEGPFIIIPLQAVLDRKIVRFMDPDNIQKVPMLAYLTTNGKLVTAMSISENCRSTDFYLVGDNIHCASCPSYWNASSLEPYACCQKYYPDPIASSVLGNEVRIEKSVARNWQPRS